MITKNNKFETFWNDNGYYDIVPFENLKEVPIWIYLGIAIQFSIEQQLLPYITTKGYGVKSLSNLELIHLETDFDKFNHFVEIEADPDTLWEAAINAVSEELEAYESWNNNKYHDSDDIEDDLPF